MDQEGQIINGEFVCDGVTIPDVPNPVQPGSPAYFVDFGCTHAGISQTIEFWGFLFYYSQNAGIWTVDIAIVGPGSNPVIAPIAVRLSVGINSNVNVFMIGNINRFYWQASNFGDTMTLQAYLDFFKQSYFFRLNSDLSPRADMSTAASAPITNNTSPPSTSLALPPSPLFSSRPSSSAEETYPQINILAFSTANDEDFGQVTYTVLDTIKHRGTYNCRNKEVSPGVYRSIFSQFPQINDILKGKGCSLKQKFTSILDIYSLDISLNDFTANMAFYVYLNNILSRLLYSHFDLKWLTPCFFDQFLKDLKKRYPIYVQFFIKPQYGIVGYQKYFECVCEK